MLLSKAFFRFLFIGCTNTLVSFMVFQTSLFLLPPFPIRAAIAQFTCYIPGLIWSFYWNSRWTFKQHNSGISTFNRFVTMQLFFMTISSLLIGIGVDYLKLPPTLTWIVIMSFFVILNLLSTKYFVFKNTLHTNTYS